MREAFGGEGYKSACNLFYMSKHIADLIDLNATPVFSNLRAKQMQIPMHLKKEINDRNGQFSMKFM